VIEENNGASNQVSSQTGSQIDNQYLALRLRHARLTAGYTLKKLAEEANCSESLISKIERASAMPSLATLHRLARALNTNIAHLMAEEDPHTGPVLKGHARTSISSGGITLERLTQPNRSNLLQGHLHIVEAGTASDGEIEHLGEEIGYVLEGEMELSVDGEKHQLGAGDSFHFSSRLKHGYRNTGAVPLKIVWINTPATF
jgi:transcriptional regulator with XRE-family HTH domain